MLRTCARSRRDWGTYGRWKEHHTGPYIIPCYLSTLIPSPPSPPSPLLHPHPIPSPPSPPSPLHPHPHPLSSLTPSPLHPHPIPSPPSSPSPLHPHPHPLSTLTPIPSPPSPPFPLHPHPHPLFTLTPIPSPPLPPFPLHPHPHPLSTYTLTWSVRLMPPLSFFLNPMLGGLLFSRIPKPSSSCSISLLCCSGFNTSRIIKMRPQVRATAITCRPRPFPSFAPSMIPGRSSNYGEGWGQIGFHGISHKDSCVSVTKLR